MIIAYDPADFSNPNSYISRMAEAIKKAFPDCKITKLPNPSEPSAFKSLDIVWVNWFENLSNYSLPSFARTLFTKLAVLFLLKLFRVKLIVTFHNKRPHEMKYPIINLLFFKLLLHASDKIIILSEESRKAIEAISNNDYSSKIYKVNHPSYVCSEKVYQQDNLRKMSVLFFGVIRPYKNIELITELAKKHPNIEFTIAGNAGGNTEYAMWLRDITKDTKNINLRIGYLTEEEIDNYLNTHDILLLPYNIESSLNSGVAIYAFSKGINIVIPKIGTIMELDSYDNVFHYTYNSQADHLDQLERKLTEAENQFRTDYQSFISRPKAIRKYTMSNNSLDTLATQIKNMWY